MEPTELFWTDKITGAVARGWCAPENSSKVMDEELAMAIVAEVVNAIQPLLAREGEGQ